MAIVRFVPLRLIANSRPDDTILDMARRVGAPIGNSCGGIGVCARCVVRVLSGSENLTATTKIELKVIEERKLPQSDRLACQAAVLGDCEVTTSYWGSTDELQKLNSI